jgi:hypothetical protein
MISLNAERSYVLRHGSNVKNRQWPMAGGSAVANVSHPGVGGYLCIA